MTNETTIKNSKLLTGTVVSNKMTKTVVVEVASFKKHPKYGKFIRRTKNYKAHVEDSAAYKVGDKVTIQETRPISKDKHFLVVTTK